MDLFVHNNVYWEWRPISNIRTFSSVNCFLFYCLKTNDVIKTDDVINHNCMLYMKCHAAPPVSKIFNRSNSFLSKPLNLELRLGVSIFCRFSALFFIDFFYFLRASMPILAVMFVTLFNSYCSAACEGFFPAFSAFLTANINFPLLAQSNSAQ